MVFEAATQIISSLDGIPSEDRKKLLYRTCTGKLMLSPELAWRRLMYTKRETERLVQEVEADPANSDKSHVQICAELAQTAYVSQFFNYVCIRKQLTYFHLFHQSLKSTKIKEDVAHVVGIYHT